jgi:hypothetical protein
VIGGAVPSGRGDDLKLANGYLLAQSPSSTGFSGKKSRIMLFCTFSIRKFPKNLLASIDALNIFAAPHVAPFDLKSYTKKLYIHCEKIEETRETIIQMELSEFLT